MSRIHKALQKAREKRQEHKQATGKGFTAGKDCLHLQPSGSGVP